MADARMSNAATFSLCLAVGIFTTIHLGQCSIVLELSHPQSLQSIKLSVGVNKTRPINLVPGHTYHISCKDTSNHIRFDFQELNIWYHNGTNNVTKIPSGDPTPSSDTAAVFSSTEINSEVRNEWTLVLQLFRRDQVGVYTCHGLDGERLSLEIGETSLAVIPSSTRHILTEGPLSNTVIALSVFILPDAPETTTITWTLNNGTTFPPEVDIINSMLFLSGRVTGEARGEYTCLVEGSGTSASAVIYVDVNAPPNLLLSPSPLTSDEVTFDGSRLSVSCADSNGFPISDIFWYRNGIILTTDGGRVRVKSFKNSSYVVSELTIDSVSPSDLGTYNCTSQSIVGTSPQRSFSIAHIIELSPHMDHVTRIEGQTISLRVQLRGYDTVTPLPIQFDWVKGGRYIRNTTRTLIREFNSSHEDHTIQLDILDAMATDSGIYSFEVSSTLGTLRVNFDPVTILDGVLFQLRLLEIGSCQDWVNTEGQSKASVVQTTILSNINRLCGGCGLDPTHISNPLFLCFPASPRSVTFRAKLYRTSEVSTSTLIGHIEEWIIRDGSISIEVVLTNIDSSCPVLVSSVRDPECGALTFPPPPTSVSSGVPVVVMIGASVGVALLLLLMVAVMLTVVLLVVFKNRRTVVATEGSSQNHDQKSKPPRSYVVNPDYSSHQLDHLDDEGLTPNSSEPHYYEDIDKYNLNGERGRIHDHCGYKEMNSAQIMPTTNKCNLEYDYAAV